jgi:hypothetical protein
MSLDTDACPGLLTVDRINDDGQRRPAPKVRYRLHRRLEARAAPWTAGAPCRRWQGDAVALPRSRRGRQVRPPPPKPDRSLQGDIT